MEDDTTETPVTTAETPEEKAKREAEAKLTDEYLQENLYPKTKYNKF